MHEHNKLQGHSFTHQVPSIPEESHDVKETDDP